ncbi:MAG: glycosyltransferase family 2 protein [Actinomycetota bacterium]|nr:glycosyltransferase family 2 protein [Actinomycetota bacterium]
MSAPSPPVEPTPDPSVTAPHRGCDVSVVIVSYRSADVLEPCLRSVCAAMAGLDGEIIVVDNASPDDSRAVAAAMPGVRVLGLDDNLGFGPAVNRGAAASAGRHLVLVNPDAEIGPDALVELIRFADEHPAHGIYGGRARTPDGSADPRSCFGLPSPWSMFCFATGLSSAFRRSPVFDPTSLGRWPRDTVREVGAVSGCLLLAPRRAWDELGGFDEDYFLYGEDIDLGARAWEAGLRPVVVPGAEVVHRVGASTPDGVERTVRLLTGRATYLRKRWHGTARVWGRAMLVVGVAGRAGAEAVLAALGGPDRGDRWRRVWRRRRTWMAGYAADGTPRRG